jgi:hydrogenase maturation protease
MTATQTVGSADLRPSRRARPPGVSVEVLVCGSVDRGDDGAPTRAVVRARSRLPRDVVVRLVGQLDIDHLLRIPAGAGVVVVDAATGISPGRVVELPLSGLIDEPGRVRSRSSHALTLPEVIGLAEMIRGHSLPGRIVAIGGARFDLGNSLSDRVAAAIDKFATAIVMATQHVRAVAPPRRASTCA